VSLARSGLEYGECRGPFALFLMGKWVVKPCLHQVALGLTCMESMVGFRLEVCLSPFKEDDPQLLGGEVLSKDIGEWLFRAVSVCRKKVG